MIEDIGESEPVPTAGRSCKDHPLAISGLLVGLGVVCLQTLGLGTDHWVFVNEPMAVNDSIDIRDQEFALYVFNVGYLQMCRNLVQEQDVNLTADATTNVENFEPFCVQSGVFGKPSNLDSNANGKVAISILIRIRNSIGIHTISILLSTGATIIAFIGYTRRNTKWLLAAIIYIFAGSVILYIGLLYGTAVMDLICVIDDEMSSHRKPTLEGKPSRYTVRYGWCCLCGSLVFLGMQYCAMVDLILYFRKFPTMKDKLRLVPGLREKVREAYLNAREVNAVSSKNSSRRNSRKSSLHSTYSTQSIYYSDLV